MKSFCASKDRKGFSILEALIWLAIALIIVAILIPTLALRRENKKSVALVGLKLPHLPDDCVQYEKMRKTPSHAANKKLLSQTRAGQPL